MVTLFGHVSLGRYDVCQGLIFIANIIADWNKTKRVPKKGREKVRKWKKLAYLRIEVVDSDQFTYAPPPQTKGGNYFYIIFYTTLI